MMLIPRTEILPVFASGMLYPLMSVEDGIRPNLQAPRVTHGDELRIDAGVNGRMFLDNWILPGSGRRSPAARRGYFRFLVTDQRLPGWLLPGKLVLII
jgi:hypothetical protein